MEDSHQKWSSFRGSGHKNYGRPVEIGEVDEFIGKIDDVDAHKGVLVSDSGFTGGAVSRAKEDHRVQLATVLDSSVASLRAKLRVPMRVTFHNIPAFTANLTVAKLVTTQSESPYLTDSDKRHVKQLAQERGPGVFRAFQEWIASHAGWDLPAGTHSEVREIGEGPIHATVTFTFGKTIRSFVNDNIFAEAIGIYDHIQKKLVEAQIKGATLEETQILAGWREVPSNAPEEQGVDHYVRLAAPSMQMVEDCLQELLDGVAKQCG